MTLIWEVPPSVVMLTGDAVSTNEAGIGLMAPKMIGVSVTEPFNGTVKRLDCPKRVMPLRMQVARARTRPWLAGILGRTHVPSAFTRTFRLSTLMVQLSFNCDHEVPPTSVHSKNNRIPRNTMPPRTCVLPNGY